MSETASDRLEALARTDPTVAPLALLQAEALRAATDHALPSTVLDPNLDARSEGRPALYRAILRIKRQDAERVVRRLAQAAARAHLAEAEAALRAVERGTIDVLVLLKASIEQDTARLEGLADAAGTDLPLLSTLGLLLSLPLLQDWRAGESDWLARGGWEAGYCPVCAAWPTLAELRGLDAERWLRCGRCGAGWRYPHGRCVYCGNIDHRTQGYLAPEGAREARRAVTCDACQNYLKTVTTFAAIPPDDLPLQDLTTLELDVAAIERGYGRPAAPGFALHLQIAGVEGHRMAWVPWRR